MKKTCALMVLAALILSACGAKSVSTQDVAAAEAAARPEQTELDFVAGGEVVRVPATLHLGEGYSIYIPQSGWRLEQEWEHGIPEDVWESTMEDDVQISVFRYPGIPAVEAATAFLDEHDDFVFRELLLDTDETAEPLEGVDEDGDVLKFILRSGVGNTYIVAWEYRNPLGSAASQAERMVRTFVVT